MLFRLDTTSGFITSGPQASTVRFCHLPCFWATSVVVSVVKRGPHFRFTSATCLQLQSTLQWTSAVAKCPYARGCSQYGEDSEKRVTHSWI